MTDYEPLTPENAALLFAAGNFEQVLHNRDANNYPRKLMSAGQLLLRALYASDLLVLCGPDGPITVTGAHGPMMIAVSDREAGEAYIASALGPDLNVAFSPVSALTDGVSVNGNWKVKRDAWRQLFNGAGATYMLLNPAGPATARIIAVAFDDGRPSRFGGSKLAELPQFPQPHERTAGRELTPEALAEFGA